MYRNTKVCVGVVCGFLFCFFEVPEGTVVRKVSLNDHFIYLFLNCV